MDYLIVAFYTLDTPYEQEVKSLVASCKALGLPVHTEGYPSLGKWELNCALKPGFIRRMLDKFPGQNLLYLDADAMVVKRPIFEDGDYDLAAHFRDGKELLSGTLFFKNLSRVKRLVDQWILVQEQHPTMWDQRTLQLAVMRNEETYCRKLPAAYCKILDADIPDPYIQHNQASRRYRRIVDTVPEVISGMRIRRETDGTYVLSRRHHAAETYLDEHCIRMKGELRWRPKGVVRSELETLVPLFKDKTCYIVGKGPSLDKISVFDFPDPTCPILALNEAIHKIETLGLLNPLYVLVKDSSLKERCRPKVAKVLATRHNINWQGESQVYVFDPKDYKLPSNCLSVLAAIAVAKRLGAAKFAMVSFDACVNKDTGYADCISAESKEGGDPGRFLNHRPRIMKLLTGYSTKWITPGSPG